MDIKDATALAKRIYPDPEDNRHYQKLVMELGEIIIYVRERDDTLYSGSTIALMHHYSECKLGILVFEWGSCNICDALWSCETHEEIGMLIHNIERSIKWFDSKSEVLDYLANHDWKGDSYIDSLILTKFTNLVKEYLTEPTEEIYAPSHS